MGDTEIMNGGLVTFTIKVDGKAIPDEVDVESIEIEKSVNRISSARISVLDGEVETQTFKISASKLFVPGNKISIEAGYDLVNKTIFEGIVTQQNIRVDNSVGSMLIVECRDEAIKMVVGRKSVTYSEQTDSDILKTMIGNYNGLSADVASTNIKWPEQVQYYSTDWDFMVARAEANGMIVSAINGKVSVFRPDADTSPVLKIAYGDNLFEINAAMDAVSQLGAVKATSWDFMTQKTVSTDVENAYKGPGNLSSKTLSKVVGLSDYEIQSTAPLESDALKGWSDATLMKSAFSKIQGDVKFQGSAVVDPGKYITLSGLGDRFNGDHFISSVFHKIAQGNWVTEVAFGLSPYWITEEPDVVAPPASGLLPGVQGLFNATVKKMYEDPENQYRVLVDIPLFDPSGEGLWARLTNFYSTSGAGAFFMPEVGDEVVVGFLNEDPRFPIILGSMYSSTKNKPLAGNEPNEGNSIKSIASKSGINIQFDDANKILTITTPDKNTAVFSDKDKSVTLKDQNDNRVVMDTKGITIKSENNISVHSSQNLKLTGEQGVSIDAPGGDVTIKGLNVKNSADMTFEARGDATAKLEGGAETVVRGAMVMIN